MEIRSDFIIAFKELQRFADLPEGSALTTAFITIAHSTDYPATNCATIQMTSLLARPAEAAESMLYVDSDCLDSQDAFLAPTACDARSQRRDVLHSETMDK